MNNWCEKYTWAFSSTCPSPSTSSRDRETPLLSEVSGHSFTHTELNCAEIDVLRPVGRRFV